MRNNPSPVTKQRLNRVISLIFRPCPFWMRLRLWSFFKHFCNNEIYLSTKMLFHIYIHVLIQLKFGKMFISKMISICLKKGFSFIRMGTELHPMRSCISYLFTYLCFFCSCKLERNSAIHFSIKQFSWHMSRRLFWIPPHYVSKWLFHC